MTDDSNIAKAHQARLKALQNEKRRILELPPEQALNQILDAPQAMAIVHSFSEEDFYFLMHDIGVDDALPILSLASNKQWQYILDLETWEKDRLHINDLTRWWERLLQADAERLVNWLQSSKIETFEYYLYKVLEVHIRQHDQDPTEFGPEFHTFEDVYYFRFIQTPLQSLTETETERERRESLIVQLLGRIANLDHFKYQSILLEAPTVLPAETEEELYRRRTVRLAEKGFQSFDEALRIYQPLDPEALFAAQSNKIVPDAIEEADYLPTPLYASGMLKEGSLFEETLKTILNDSVLEQLQMEFAALCNTIIAADQKRVREKEALNAMVKKAGGYISIGLEILMETDASASSSNRSEWIQRYPLLDLYRVGYGRAVKLKWRAEKFRKTSWFFNQKLSLKFWDEEGLGVLGGLLLKQPLFFDNYANGELYREFSHLADLNKTADMLDALIGLDDLFSLLEIKVATSSEVVPTYKNVLLTLWAKHQLGLAEDLTHLHFDAFKTFFTQLWEQDQLPRKISLASRESFLKWLCERSHLSDFEINQRLGNILEALFSAIEKEFEYVATKDLDPRFIFLFLIEIE